MIKLKSIVLFLKILACFVAQRNFENVIQIRSSYLVTLKILKQSGLFQGLVLEMFGKLSFFLGV